MTPFSKVRVSVMSPPKPFAVSVLVSACLIKMIFVDSANDNTMGVLAVGICYNLVHLSNPTTNQSFIREVIC